MKPNRSTTALSRAIEKWPSLKAFAGELGVPYQTVQQWVKNGVPASYCPDIEKLTGGACRCEELNPSVDWTYLRGTVAQSNPNPQPAAVTADKPAKEVA